MIISHERELAVSCRYVKNFPLTILHLHGDDENIVSDLIGSFHVSNLFFSLQNILDWFVAMILDIQASS